MTESLARDGSVWGDRARSTAFELPAETPLTVYRIPCMSQLGYTN